MRRIFSCVLMMTLLLTSCGKRGDDSPENLAAQIRAEYLGLSGWSSHVEISADYGKQVFDFAVNASWKRDGDTVIHVTEPDLIAGVTARTKAEETVLEYDGLCLETGSLDKSGLTPISALPAMLRAVREEYLTSYSFEEDGSLRVSCGAPNLPLGTGTEYTLWFHPETHDLTRERKRFL